MKLRTFTSEDWEAVKAIYVQGIETGNATFQQEAPEWPAWDSAHLPFGRIVAVKDNTIVGWCALSPVSSRCVYAGVAEVSVYVDTRFLGQRIGSLLMEVLITASEENGIWTLQSGVFPENKASLVLHEKAGFRTVGYREQIGKMKGAWRNTILLERRSTKII